MSFVNVLIGLANSKQLKLLKSKTRRGWNCVYYCYHNWTWQWETDFDKEETNEGKSQHKTEGVEKLTSFEGINCIIIIIITKEDDASSKLAWKVSLFSSASEKAVFVVQELIRHRDKSQVCARHKESQAEKHLCANDDEGIIYAQEKELEEQETGNNKIQIWPKVKALQIQFHLNIFRCK